MWNEVCNRDDVTGEPVDGDSLQGPISELAWTSVCVENKHSFGLITDHWTSLDASKRLLHMGFD